MKNSIVIRLGLAVLVTYTAFIGGCQSPVEPEKEKPATVTKVTGTVLRSDNLSPVADAIVADTRGLPADTTAADGKFELSYQISADYSGRIVARKAGYRADTTSIFLAVGKDSAITMVLGVDSTSPPPGVSTGKPASIILVSSSDVNVSIRGTGLNETVTLIFEVRDSLGVPVGGTNKATVLFRINGGPGGGEYIYPASAVTDPATGRVTTRITSGTRAGVLQVFATVYVDSVNFIQSTPVRVTISGGMPSPTHFSLSAEKLNIAGGVFDNLRNRITVIVGDREGNPVPAGTAVYFTTTGGIIQPSAVTNADGIASVDLISANPRPAGGFVTVTARTIGDTANPNVTRSMQVLFSGSTQITMPGSFAIQDSGSLQLQYRVADASSNPLVAGSSIAVKLEGPAAGDVELSGDTEYTFQDTQDPNVTNFRVTIRDKAKGGIGGQVTLKVTVSSQNGNVTASVDGLVGTSQTIDPGPIGGTSSGYAATLTLLNIVTPQISVRGTGENESTRLTFIARDSVGNPITSDRKAGITFTLTGPAGGEFIFPTFDSTGANGTVTTTLTSGTQAGVVQVQASAVVNGRTIFSAPTRITISGGLPDANKFITSLAPVNMRGLVSTSALGLVEVQLGDQFGNPVQPGTALYFSTSGGLIQPFAQTDESGKASVVLFGGSEPSTPGRGAGYGTVTIRTIGAGGTNISKTLPFLFSGTPIVNTPVSYDGFLIPDGAAQTFTYSVADKNGNPIAAGNQVSVSISGGGAGEVRLSGETSVSFTDDTVRGRTYNFTISDLAAGSGQGGPLEVTITANGVSGSHSKKIVGSIGAPGTVQPPVPISRTPARITFVSVSSPSISVAGVGALENSVVTYEVQDSLGRPMDNISRAYATFEVQWFPNSRWSGGTAPSVLPAADSTDAQGRVRASVVSGTQAGVLQVLVKIDIGGGTIVRSEPVRISVYAGFPDQAHFTLASTRYVFPTASIGQAATTLAVAVGDTFSNPVSTGTAVYFHSQAGVTQTGALTNNLGQATTNFFTVNPTPTTLPYYKNDIGYGPGYFYITAQTQGRFGIEIKDSILVYWAIGPVQITGLPDSTTIVQGGTSPLISFTATDGRGKPLPDGTNISVSVSYPTDVTGLSFGTTGNLPATIPAAPYAIMNQSGITDFSFRVVDQSTGGGATVGLAVTIEVVVDSPGLGRVVKKFLGRVI